MSEKLCTYATAARTSQFQQISSFAEKFDGLHGEKNKRLPKEFQEAAEEQPLLYNKSYYHFVHLPAAHIPQDDLIDVIMDYHLAARPMRHFLTEAIGAE